MSESIQAYLLAANDNDAPLVSKPSLQQYDNYQIYDIYCVDIIYDVVLNGITTNKQDKGIYQLAVQAYSPNVVKCDFNALVIQYP